jgi:BolA protein
VLNNQDRITAIRERLQKLQPEKLQVIDESQHHVGHAGAQSGAGHFALVIRSDQFHEKSLVECHRMIYAALGDLMETDIHALKIKIEK